MHTAAIASAIEVDLERLAHDGGGIGAGRGRMSSSDGGLLASALLAGC